MTAFLECIHEIYRGMKIYRLLRKQHGRKGGTIFVSQHPAIGDAYLISSYLKRYMQDKPHLITYIGNASKEIYALYGFNGLYELTQEQTNQLIRYVQFMEMPPEKVFILHYQALIEHTGIAFQFNGINHLCFADLIESMLFPQYSRVDRIYPTISKNKLWRIPAKKSVIFFPSANTLLTPPREFWNELVEKYKGMGKSVFTYVNANELPIDGTLEITCELKDLPGLVEQAGEVIGVRSGLMDIISQTKCKKTIYYPQEGARTWIFGSIREFWSLKKFGYETECEEIEWI